MSNKRKRGLGKGLDALLGDNVKDVPSGDETVALLPLDDVEPGPYQPRTEIDPEALNELADSIRAQGIVQPIVVRPKAGRGYEIVAGERRWRAARIAGLDAVPALVRDLPDRTVLAVGLIENIQRESLNSLDEAQALQRLITECGLTHEQCAEAVGRSRAAVTNLLRLLQLAEPVQEHLKAGRLGMGHARALLGLPKMLQGEAATRVVNNDLSVRDAEALVRSILEVRKKTRKKGKVEVEDRFLVHRDKLAEKLRAKVQLAAAAGGKGKLVIHYRTMAELESIFQRLG